MALCYSNDNSDSDSPLPQKSVRRNKRHHPDTAMKVFFPNCEGRLKCTESEKKKNACWFVEQCEHFMLSLSHNITQ
jgi:hypothetical protein